MALPKFYLFDMSLPGQLSVTFDVHVNHVQNLREHLEGFSRTPEQEFVLHGSVNGSVVLCANGDPKRMKDGVILLFGDKTCIDEWTLAVSWPLRTEELSGFRLTIPGRWLTMEESARTWLSWHGVSVKDEAHLASEEIRSKLLARGVSSIERFGHPGLRDA
jgi:hypothetical protein